MRVQLFELTEAARRADEALLRMEPRARDELAKEAQRRASALGLLRGATPIPLVLSPCALPREELAALGRGARLITSALVKVARDLIERRPEKARLLFDHLSPLESAALQSRWREAEELLHSRIDWFVGRDGGVKALEVNATIRTASAIVTCSPASSSPHRRSAGPSSTRKSTGCGTGWMAGWRRKGSSPNSRWGPRVPGFSAARSGAPSPSWCPGPGCSTTSTIPRSGTVTGMCSRSPTITGARAW